MTSTESLERNLRGRPLAHKNDVDARLLDAATNLFLKLGFEGTSCDQVAQQARAGKASIYARYANKTALFAAVIQTNLDRLFEAGAGGDEAAVRDMPLRDRMVAAGRTVVAHALQPDAIALLRLLVAEAPRLDRQGLDATAIVQRLGIRRVALAIAGPAKPSGDDAGLDAVTAAAEALVDLLLLPVLLRALLGADLDALRDAALAHVPAAVDHVTASAALDRWR